MFAVIAILILAGSLQRTGTFLGVSTLLVYTMNMLIIGMHEELLMRGFVLNAMVERWKNKTHGIMLAVLSSSAIFSLMHFTNLTTGNVTTTIAQVVYATTIGIFFASIFVRTKNLYGLVLLHAFVDWCFYFAARCFLSTGKAAETNPVVLVVGSLLFQALGLYYLRKAGIKTAVKED